MEKEKPLPNVIFMSPEVAETVRNQITEDAACVFIDKEGVKVTNSSLYEEDIDERATYRNLVQLWHPAKEKPHCIGQILCMRHNRSNFVHDHYSHDDESWQMFVTNNEVLCYCYIANLHPF